MEMAPTSETPETVHETAYEDAENCSALDSLFAAVEALVSDTSSLPPRAPVIRSLSDTAAQIISCNAEIHSRQDPNPLSTAHPGTLRRFPLLMCKPRDPEAVIAEANPAKRKLPARKLPVRKLPARKLPDESADASSASDDDPTDAACFEVDRILKKRTRRGKVEYKVQWKGFSHEHDSWLPFENFTDRNPETSIVFAFEKLTAGTSRNPTAFVAPADTPQVLNVSSSDTKCYRTCSKCNVSMTINNIGRHVCFKTSKDRDNTETCPKCERTFFASHFVSHHCEGRQKEVASKEVPVVDNRLDEAAELQVVMPKTKQPLTVTSTAVSWKQKAEHAMSQPTPVQELRALLESGRELEGALPEIDEIEQRLDTAEQWCDQVKDLFRGKRSNKTLAEAMGFEYIVKYQMVRSEQSQLAAQQCVCRKVKTLWMVKCDQCHESFHGKCVNISKVALQQQVAFKCPVCYVKENLPYPHDCQKPHGTRPTYAEVKGLLESADSLLVQCDEREMIAYAIRKADEWEPRMKAALEQQGHANELSLDQLEAILAETTTWPLQVDKTENLVIAIHLRKKDAMLAAPKRPTLAQVPQLASRTVPRLAFMSICCHRLRRCFQSSNPRCVILIYTERQNSTIYRS